MSAEDNDAIPVEVESTNNQHGVSSAGDGVDIVDYFKHSAETSSHRIAEVAKHVGKGGVKQRASMFMGSPKAASPMANTSPQTPARRQSKFVQNLAGGSLGDKCVSCSKTVYVAERMTCPLGYFHKNCFRCGLKTGRGCGSGLNANTYDVYSGIIFCKTCSKKQHHGEKQQKALSGESIASPQGVSPAGAERRLSWKERNAAEGRASFGSPKGASPTSSEIASISAEEQNPKPVPVTSVMGIFSSMSMDEGDEEAEAENEVEAETEKEATITAETETEKEATITAETENEEAATTAEAAITDDAEVHATTEGSKSFDKDDEHSSNDEEDEEEEDAFEVEPVGPKGGTSPTAARRPSFNPLPGQKSFHECPFTFPFDKNGAIYWVGTMGGQMEYENPQKTGSLYLEISTLYRGQLLNITSYANAETAADRIAAATYTNNTGRSWLVVDFGPERSLRPSYYCLKHGASGIGNAIRNWTLEAKVTEDDPWVELRRHSNDTTMREEPQSVAGYELSSDLCKNNFFRIFRITQVGKNSGGNDCLFIGGIDFYGIMRVGADLAGPDQE